MNDHPVVIPPEIREFLENLLTDANILNLDETQREGMIQELFVQLDNFIAATVVKSLPPEKLEEFMKMSEEKRPQEELQTFLQSNVPDAQKVFTDAFTQFRNLYLKNTGDNVPSAENSTN